MIKTIKINILIWSPRIPVKSHADFGLMIPELGLTQNLFGEVVFTCQTKIHRICNENTSYKKEKNLHYYHISDTLIDTEKSTLKATYSSDVFERCTDEVLCFFTSPAISNIKDQSMSPNSRVSHLCIYC